MSPFVRPKSIHRGDRLLAVAVFYLVLGLYTLTFSGLPDNPDAEVEFQTTSALARNGSLALGGTPEAEGIVALPNDRGGTGFDVMEGRGERAGRWYSWFGVGQALVGVPFYWVGGALARAFPEVEEAHRATLAYGVGRSEYFEHLLVGWRNPLLGALTAWLLVFTARRLGASRPAAFFGALSYGLCTFAWPQARSTLSDVQATFFLFFAFHLVLRFRESFQRLRPLHAPEQMLFGAAVGLAFLTRVLTAPAVAILVIAYVAVCVRGRARAGEPGNVLRDLAVGLVPALAALGAFLWINQLRFGDPLETGYGDAVGADYFRGYPLHEGLAALFLSPGRGLVWLAPGAIVAAFGVWASWQRGERLWPLVLTALFVGVAVPPAMTLGWGGAWTFGPRYVLPLLPVLWLGVPLALDVALSRRKVLAPALCVAAGLLPNLGAALVDHMTHQELAVVAARLEWPELEDVDERTAESVRFDRVQWDWRFAAPWAHWRILRHRVALGDERFGVDEIFFLDRADELEPETARSRGWLHLAWYDLEHRLEGQAWPILLVGSLLVLAGLVQVARGFDRTLA